MIAFYLLFLAAPTWNSLKGLQYALPLCYHNAVALLQQGKLNLWGIVLHAGMTLSCMAASAIVYRRKDILV